MRAMARIFGVNRNTVLAWLKKSRAFAAAQDNAGEGQENGRSGTRYGVMHSCAYEMQHWLPGGWSLVCRRKNKRWVWLAQCRRNRQIVAYAVGDRSEATCRVWGRIPQRYKECLCYKKCLCYTDFWAACAEVLPAEQHHAMGKGAGQTCHITPI